MIELYLKKQHLISETTAEPMRRDKIITNANSETQSSGSEEGACHQEVNWINEDLTVTGL